MPKQMEISIIGNVIELSEDTRRSVSRRKLFSISLSERRLMRFGSEKNLSRSTMYIM